MVNVALGLTGSRTSVTLLVESDRDCYVRINNLQRKPLSSNKHRALKMYKVSENKSKMLLKIHFSICLYTQPYITAKRERER